MSKKQSRQAKEAANLVFYMLSFIIEVVVLIVCWVSDQCKK